MARVFVSSTYLDLQDCRRLVSLVLHRMGHEDVAMEYYVAEDKRPVERCLEDVEACDLYVGIFAWRYGWIPKKRNRKKLSITEMEYRVAAKGKECLIFLLDGKIAWPPDFTDDDKTRIKKLREELSEDKSAAYFKSAEDLGRLVAEAIHNWEKGHGSLPRGNLVPQFDLPAYYDALKKRYHHLDLDTLTPPGKEEYLQLQLRSIFVEQNVRESVPPLELSKDIWEKLQQDKEIQPEDIPENITSDDIRRLREAYFQKPMRSVLDVLTDPQYPHAVVLGDPGSGKSTLARYILLSVIDPLAANRVQSAFGNHLPILVELRSYASLRADGRCETFLEFLEYLGKRNLSMK